jgi:hypothetical protein
MKTSELIKSNFIRAVDLAGGPKTYTIASVANEEVGRDREEKPVMRFREVSPGLVLNVTKLKQCTEIFGDEETDSWVGRRITLRLGETEFAGKTVPCIRLAEPSSPRPEPGGDDVNF